MDDPKTFEEHVAAGRRLLDQVPGLRETIEAESKPPEKVTAKFLRRLVSEYDGIEPAAVSRGQILWALSELSKRIGPVVLVCDEGETSQLGRHVLQRGRPDPNRLDNAFRAATEELRACSVREIAQEEVRADALEERTSALREAAPALNELFRDAWVDIDQALARWPLSRSRIYNAAREPNPQVRTKLVPGKHRHKPRKLFNSSDLFRLVTSKS